MARVVGLWIAMILSPFVFFTYTVPSLKDMKMVGWTKWWPETLKLAFLAPIFIFFMYLIIAFLEKGLSLVKANQTTDGMSFVISIIVPFVFIMILLMKAKDIAKDMSGELGQSITNGVKAIGGIALGGAALGTAALGRKFIGGTLAKASRGDTLSQRFMDPSKKANMNWIQKTGGWVASGAGTGMGINKLHDWTGGKLNEKQKAVNKVDHARHEIDETKKAAGLEGIDDSKLSGVDEEKMKTTFAKTKRSETEAKVRKGETYKDENGNDVTPESEDSYKAANRSRVASDIGQDPNSVDANTGELTDEAKKRVENQLNVEFNAVLKTNTDQRLASEFEHLKKESREHVNPITRTFAGANKASYDVRKLSDIKSDKRESGVFSKVPVALIAGIATGVRAGMKNVGVSNGGIKVEGNFMKDLGNTIGDSLKSMKVSVDLSHVGEHKSSADAHGGGGGGHH